MDQFSQQLKHSILIANRTQMSEFIQHTINDANYWLDTKTKVLYEILDDCTPGQPVGFLPPITTTQEARNERLLEITSGFSYCGNTDEINEVYELIAAGADVNALELLKPAREQTGPKWIYTEIPDGPTIHPYPPLWRAVIANKIDLIPILIAAGADTTIQIGGKTLLEKVSEYYEIEYNEADTNSIGDAIVKMLAKRKEKEDKEISEAVDELINLV